MQITESAHTCVDTRKRNVRNFIAVLQTLDSQWPVLFGLMSICSTPVKKQRLQSNKADVESHFRPLLFGNASNMPGGRKLGLKFGSSKGFRPSFAARSTASVLTALAATTVTDC
jgi:hypothetical protein